MPGGGKAGRRLSAEANQQPIRTNVKNSTIPRAILWLSLAGMVLALHLWIQKARGFDQGCLGLESHAVGVAEGGCADETLQASSHLFGVSNAAWGYAFYFTLALLAFAKIVVSAPWARRFHVVGEGVVAVGFVYSAYLLYFQAFVAGAFCVLCLTSIGLVTTLLILHLVLRLKGGFEPVAEPNRLVELGVAGGSLFAAMGVLVGMLIFVNRLGTRPLDDGNGALEMRRIVGRMLPAFIEGSKLTEMAACHFDRLSAPIDEARFVGPATPFLGSADGVPVLVFLDPYCPHCRDFYPRLAKLAETYGDRAKFYVVPRALWDQSVPAVAALQLAEGSGKYFELLKLETSQNLKRWFTVKELAGFYEQLGLDATGLAARIEAARPQVLATRRRQVAAGITSVPAIFIGDQRVFPTNYTDDCIGRLIEQARRQAEAGAPRR